MTWADVSVLNKKYRQIVTLDFETYFSKDYSLKSKDLNTSEYIRHPEFKVQCVGLKINTDPVVWYRDRDVEAALRSIDWGSSALLAHHAAFDGLVLSHHYGIVPRYYLDTLSMARALHSNALGASLDTVARFYGLGNKLPDVLDKTKGLRDLPEELMEQLGTYCAVDVELCRLLYDKMSQGFPTDELDLIDMTVRMFCDPVLELDLPRVQKALDAEIVEKNLRIEEAGVPIETLSSSTKFADELLKRGVEPPVKKSPTTGNTTFAFSKNDLEFIALLDHHDQQVRDLVRGRLSAKSTIAETRAWRFLQMGADGKKLPVYLSYYGAHTGRWSGGNKANLQNLPRGGELRKSILAPAGHSLVVVDSAQIEARVTAWLAGDQELLDLFGQGADVYKHMASKIYSRPVADITKEQRFIGKVACLSADTLVLTDAGWKQIVDVSILDCVWDGVEWVNHEGTLPRGIKQTELAHSVRATADHEILTEHGWQAWGEVRTNPSLLRSALATANLPLSTGAPTHAKLDGPPAGNPLCVAAVGGKVWSIVKIFCLGVLHAATRAERSQRLPSDTGFTSQRLMTTSTGLGYSIGFHRLSGDATFNQTRCIGTTVSAGYKCSNSGETIAQRFFGMCRRLKVGTTRFSTWIGLMSTKGMSPATSGLYPAPKTLQTNAESLTSKTSSKPLRKSEMTYDLLSAGPRNRFTIWSDRGPLIVHNCLGLGYGLGAEKFRHVLAAGAMGPAVQLSGSECFHIVRTYRHTRVAIVNLWGRMERMLVNLCERKPDEYKQLRSDAECKLWLPNGLYLQYPFIEGDYDIERGRYVDMRYYDYEQGIKARFGVKLEAEKGKKIYGGLLTENVVQALARIIVAGQMLEISRRMVDLHAPETVRRMARAAKMPIGRVVTMTHDEVVVCTPDEYADQVLQMMLVQMRTAPAWCSDIPLDAEGGYAHNYSK